MDQILVEISAFTSGGRAVEQEIFPDALQAIALDALAQAMAASASGPALPGADAARLVEGLKTVQELAKTPSAAGAPRGQWVCSGYPLLAGGKLLTLKRSAPNEVEMGFQCDAGGHLYGQFYLTQPGAEGETTLSFYLQRAGSGWVLHGNHGEPFQAALPVPAEAISWNSDTLMAYQEKLKIETDGAPLFSQVAAALPEVAVQAVQAIRPPAPSAPEAAAALLSSQATVVHSSGAGIFLVLEASGQRLPLLGPLTIGRDKEDDLYLDDTEVSRKHAVIEPTVGGWQLRDLNSSNGTWLNGKRLTAPTPLAEGDVITFGKTRVRVKKRQE